jgi:hypothetical protein
LHCAGAALTPSRWDPILALSLRCRSCSAGVEVPILALRRRSDRASICDFGRCVMKPIALESHFSSCQHFCPRLNASVYTSVSKFANRMEAGVGDQKGVEISSNLYGNPLTASQLVT